MVSALGMKRKVDFANFLIKIIVKEFFNVSGLVLDKLWNAILTVKLFWYYNNFRHLFSLFVIMNMEEKRNLFDDDLEFISSNPLISSTFYLKPDNTESVLLVLTPKCIFYHLPENRQARKGFLITFDSIFQILRPKPKTE